MSKFTLDPDSRKVVILLLLLGLGFNVATFLMFRVKSANQIIDFRKNLDSVYDEKFNALKVDIDNFLQFVTTNKVSSSSFSSPSSSSSDSVNTPILPVVDSIDFDYFIHEGRHIAKIGGQYFSSGSPYPHGGTITRVYPDSIILDGKYRVSRSSSVSSRSSSSSSSSDYNDIFHAYTYKN